jgi:uncharacterized membrane protein YphA (DoxX/SURF4 family)
LILTMTKTSFHILRVGVAITFLWIGILIFKNPESWGGYLQPWAAGLLPLPLEKAMIGTAILDILIGFFLLIDFLTWLAAFFGTIHLIIVLAVSGITDITVRDIGLLAAIIVLLIDSLPVNILKSKKY